MNEIDRNISRLGSMIYRKKALAALIDIGEPAVLPLLRALHHRDEVVRRCAAIALGEIGDVRAVVPLCEALQDFNGAVRAAGSTALVRIGAPAVIPILDMVRSIRNASQQTFMEALVAPIVGTRKPDLHIAISLLGDLGPEAVPHLLEALKEEDSIMRCTAATALGAIKDVRAIPALADLLSDSDQALRICGTAALGRIGDRAVVPILCEALTHADAQVRFIAASALGRTVDERAVTSLCQAARDRDYTVRNAASLALNMMGDAHMLPLIILTSAHLTPAQKYDSLEALRVRARKGELNFRHGSPTIEEYCRTVMEQAAAPSLYEDARLVLDEAERREQRHSYLRASMASDQSGQLLRAASGKDNAPGPDELVRASHSPNPGGLDVT